MNSKASFWPPLMLKVKMAATAIGEVLLVQGVVGVVRQAGVVDLLHLGVMGQKLPGAEGKKTAASDNTVTEAENKERRSGDNASMASL